MIVVHDGKDRYAALKHENGGHIGYMSLHDATLISGIVNSFEDEKDDYVDGDLDTRKMTPNEFVAHVGHRNN